MLFQNLIDQKNIFFDEKYNIWLRNRALWLPNPTALRQLLLCQWNSLIVHCRSAINLSVCTPGVIFTKMAELLLDSDIRIWVFLPIIMITFLVGVLRHYLSTIISSQKKVELQQVQDRYHHSHLLLVNLIQLVFLSFFFFQSGAGSFQVTPRKWETSA